MNSLMGISKPYGFDKIGDEFREAYPAAIMRYTQVV